MSSPRKLSNLADREKIHGNLSLFKTSPLVKPKVPRSPKVHSSPKLKKSNVAIMNNADSESNKRIVRIVMGADLTPTSPKFAVETPTNIDNGVIFW